MMDEKTILKYLKLRLLDLAYVNKVGHLSSAFTSLPIIYHIYQHEMKQGDKFILGNGHAGLALYVVLSYLFNIDDNDYYRKYNIHPHREAANLIDCSTGSLGHGIPIALGMAIANPNIVVHCLESDGSMNEGSTWEALQLKANLGIKNLCVYYNLNGSSAFQTIDTAKLVERIYGFDDEASIFLTQNPPLLGGVQGHYKILTEGEYNVWREELLSA